MADIKGVDVFAAGTWNGDGYTVDDLDEMVRAYSETSAKVKPAIKLGHPEKQSIIQKEGWPAGGWVTSLYRLGDKLKADFSDVPEKLADLIRKKAYRKVSSEVYWNFNFEGKVYKRMLSAVALLGDQMPAVTSLDDVLALYGSVAKADRVGAFASAGSELTLKNITLENSENLEAAMPKTEAEIKLEYDLKTATEKAEAADKARAKAEADLAAKGDLEKENATLKQFKLDSEKRAVEDAAKLAEAKIDAAVVELQAAGLCSPAMKPYVRELLGSEKKEYAIDSKKFDRVALVRETLKLHAAAEAVNFTEQTQRETEGTERKTAESALEQKVAKYAQEHKVTYGSAYREVMKAEKKET